jgi:hypothetical protein
MDDTRELLKTFAEAFAGSNLKFFPIDVNKPTEKQISSIQSRREDNLGPKTCGVCFGPAEKKCSRCRREWYCCKEHQNQGYPNHKETCLATTKRLYRNCSVCLKDVHLDSGIWTDVDATGIYCCDSCKTDKKLEWKFMRPMLDYNPLYTDKARAQEKLVPKRFPSCKTGFTVLNNTL